MNVCPFPGASANYMYHYLRLLLQKYPNTIILHVHTNNCVNESFRVVLDKILNLKTFIQNYLPECKVTISNINNRTDDGKASLTVENLNNHLDFLKLDIVDNSTIGKEFLGKKAFHLTKRGTGKLAISFINEIRRLWQLTDSFHAPHLPSSVTVSPNDAHASFSQNSQFKEQSENENLGDIADEILRHLKLKNENRLVTGYLKINFLRNKFDSF